MRMSIRMRSWAGLAIGIVTSIQVVTAQRPGSPSSSGATTGPGPSMAPPNLTGRSDGPPIGSLNGGIYLSGNVMLDDGNAPPDPVTIERVCNGAPRAQGYTDKKGRFSFQIGQSSGVMQDASEGGSVLQGTSHSGAGVSNSIGSQQSQTPNAPDLELANCDLRAVLAGFRSDTVSLGARRVLDDSNVGTIVLHRLANVEGSAVSVTSLEAPKEARRAYQRALQNIRKNKLAEAVKDLQKAVEIYPNYAAAWYELGRTQEQNEDLEQARKSYAKAIMADAKFVSPYLKLAGMEFRGESWAGLADTTSRLLKLDAVDYPVVYYYSATANLNLGQFGAAEKSARAGEKLDPTHRYPRLEQVLATILAWKKDYVGAAAHLRNYVALAPDAEDAARMKRELAELERLSGATEQAKAAARE